MINPLISIITVCFNSEKTIGDTIESVLNQSYTNIEYILIDGQSTDRTVEIIKEYQQLFSTKNIKYHYISEPDKGIYDAMNKGLKMAHGNLIGIINSDDWYELNACELMSDAYHKHPEAGIFAGTLRYLTQLNGTYYSKLIASYHKNMNLDMHLQHPTVFVRSELYQSNKFDTSYRIIADWVLLRKLYNDGVKIFIMDDVIANFRDGGASARHGIKLIRERINLLHKNLTRSTILAYIKEYIKLYRKLILQKLKPKWFTTLRQKQMILSSCTIYTISKKS